MGDGLPVWILLHSTLSKVPLVVRLALAHSLRLSKDPSTWDLRTVLVVRILRAYLNTDNPLPLSKAQHLSLKWLEAPVDDSMWVAPVAFPPPLDHDLGNQFRAAFDALKTGDETFTMPDLVPVEAEWTGRRNRRGKAKPPKTATAAETYERMMQEVESDVTILYIHGGAY
ncbi:MAG: hypothetical protein M1833_004914 [Piccolia ochrophora]|nr:MAG: hypothetical protein M1833_004914 [Piccolia ochrophora]